MKRTGGCSLLAALLSGAPAVADDPPEEQDAPAPSERPLLWDKEKAPAPENFLEEPPPEPLIAGPGPWELHPKDTPVITGPWAVDRRGEAPMDIDRDGSARPPAPPVTHWGAGPEDTDGVDDSPWDQTRRSDEEVAQMAPLGDHFQVRILAHEPDALLIELPILVAKSPSSFQGPNYWLVVEIFVGGKKVGDHRLMVSRQTLATMGPTHAWVKALVPTPKPQGELTIRVLRLDAGSSEIRPVFQRKLTYGK